MHMADALVSPAVGGAMWAASAAAVALSSSKVSRDADDRKVPLMGALGAFIFAAQMINFSIPGTGSSGHLGGGLLLALLLGPSAAFLTMTSVVLLQALLFADGGLVAMGCNIFNLGFIPAFIAYPCYRKLCGDSARGFGGTAATALSAVIALELGAFAVVVETVASGISSLPLTTFLPLMLSIHLPIGLAEGVITAAAFSFFRRARPELFASQHQIRNTAFAVVVCALVTAGALSWFASKDPDGLEWTVDKVKGVTTVLPPASSALSRWQEKISLFPGYRPKTPAPRQVNPATSRVTIDPSASVAGIFGTVLTLVLIVFTGMILKMKKRGNS